MLTTFAGRGIRHAPAQGVMFLIWRFRVSSRPVAPTEALRTSVYQIAVGDHLASAFTVPHNGYQYLVTAAHAVEDVSAGSMLEIRYGSEFKPVTVVEIRISPKELDIAILGLHRPLFNAIDTNYAGAALYLGQEVGFLGFPLGISARDIAGGTQWPMPLLKKGYISAFMGQNTGSEIYYLDAHNNVGFSGGPVFCIDYETRKQTVIAVVANYHLECIANEGEKTEKAEQLMANAGIMECHSLRAAFSIIDGDNFGYPLQGET